jgi:hypothetical protein
VPLAPGDIVINEVYYDPLRTGIDAAHEWFELLNRTAGTLELAGWEVADNHGSDPIPSLTLQPDAYVVVAAGTGFFDEFPEFSGQIAFIADGRIGNGLSNSGDRLALVDPAGRTIDSLSYGGDAGLMSPPCPDVKAGHSLERRPAGLDTDSASDFVENEAPSPGFGLAFATPTPSPAATATPSPEPAPSATAVPSLTPLPSATTELPQAPAQVRAAATPARDAPEPGPSVSPNSANAAVPALAAAATPRPGEIASREVPKVRMWLYVIILCSALLIGSGSVVAVRSVRGRKR